MKVTLLAVGKLRPSYRSACDDYLKRIRRHLSVAEIEVREASRMPSAHAAMEAEGQRLSERIPSHAQTVALARGGSAWSSMELSVQLKRWQESGRPLCLLIGGSHGLPDHLMAAADQRWSLGNLTLPHELARVVVLEQLYRAGTILRNEPYHKGRA